MTSAPTAPSDQTTKPVAVAASRPGSTVSPAAGVLAALLVALSRRRRRGSSGGGGASAAADGRLAGGRVLEAWRELGDTGRDLASPGHRLVPRAGPPTRLVA